jgi:hypothetical protein
MAIKDLKEASNELVFLLVKGDVLKARLMCAQFAKEKDGGRQVFRLIFKSLTASTACLPYRYLSKFDNGSSLRYLAWVPIVNTGALERFYGVIQFLEQRSKLPLGKILTISKFNDNLLYLKPAIFKDLFERGILVLSKKALELQKSSYRLGPIAHHDTLRYVDNNITESFFGKEAEVHERMVFIGRFLQRVIANVEYLLAQNI